MRRLFSAVRACWGVCLGVLLLAVVGSGFSGSCFAQSADTAFALTDLMGTGAPGAAVAAVQPGQAAPARKGGGDSSNRFGVAVNVSTLGIGGDLAVRLTHRINVRAGGNFMSLSHTFSKDGITYGGQLHFRSAEAYLDWFFLGPLHLSGGALLYNGNNIAATVSATGGQFFELNGTTYESASGANPLGGNAMLSLNKVAPAVLLGVGNMIPRSGRHFGAHFEIGGMYEGSPNFVLNLTGNACQQSSGTCNGGTPVANITNFQTNLAAEQGKLNHDAAPFKFYPIISTGFSVAF